ncbi:MAG: phage protease [Phycisphaerae bacterium]
MNKQSTQQADEQHELTPLDAAHVAAPEVPTRVRIAPWGEVKSTQGSFIVDEESARLVVEAFEEHGADLPIDYEHQTLGGPYSSPTGQAPAAGWIKRLESEPGEGIFAHVEWTAPALEQVAAKQYRYLSPVALVRKSDRKLVGLHSVALTNKPAIVGMDPIVNKDAPIGDVVRALRERLELEPECDVDVVLVAASRRLDAFERDRTRRDVEGRVAAAVRGGRITEAQRDYATRLALSNRELFDEWLRTAPAVVPLGRTVPPAGTEAAGSAHGIAAGARSEYRAHPELAALTSEEAFVNDALRQQGSPAGK